MPYYHVMLETSEVVKKTGENKKHFQYDNIDLDFLKTNIIRPFLRKEEFCFDGAKFDQFSVKRVKVKKTEKKAAEITELVNNNLPPMVLGFISKQTVIFEGDNHAEDITDSLFQGIKLDVSPISSKVNTQDLFFDSKKIFIAHGQDAGLTHEVARFIESLGFDAVILHEQANGGKTIVEKLEANTNVGFAIVLYTPCDQGGLAGGPQKSRARQNVVFEHGYLIAKLGRERVCVLVKGDIEHPSDMDGVVYIPNTHWQLKIAKELKKLGYLVDMNKLVLPV